MEEQVRRVHERRRLIRDARAPAPDARGRATPRRCRTGNPGTPGPSSSNRRTPLAAHEDHRARAIICSTCCASRALTSSKSVCRSSMLAPGWRRTCRHDRMPRASAFDGVAVARRRRRRGRQQYDVRRRHERAPRGTPAASRPCRPSPCRRRSARRCPPHQRAIVWPARRARRASRRRSPAAARRAVPPDARPSCRRSR